MTDSSQSHDGLLVEPELLKAEDARLRKYFENLGKICTFERETGKTSTFFYDFGII